MAQVHINSVNKIFDDGTEALKPLGIDIADGEFLVLVGPSGCGKSTLLRIVAGLETPTEGSIHIDNNDVTELDPALRDIAMVFQNYALYPHMSVYKNMAYGLKNRGKSKSDIQQAVAKAATLLDIEPYLKRKPSQLSGGQRQRVAMGRAIVRDPALFLFDEPLSNLDAKLRNQMRIEIRKLQRELGVTSMYVTHDQVEAMTMADRIVVLNNGSIEQIGTPTEIYHTPASVFVAEFMGAPPMNMLDAQYDGGKVKVAGALLDVDGQMTAGSGEIKLGIRPENVSIASAPGENTIPVTVNYIEELGAGRLLHSSLGDSPFVVHVPNDEEVNGTSLHAQLPAASLLLFDKVSGKRL